jgi:predicted extracellular nuclease
MKDFNSYLLEDPELAQTGHEACSNACRPQTVTPTCLAAETGALDHAYASLRPCAASQVQLDRAWPPDELALTDYNTDFNTDDRFAPALCVRPTRCWWA